MGFACSRTRDVIHIRVVCTWTIPDECFANHSLEKNSGPWISLILLQHLIILFFFFPDIHLSLPLLQIKQNLFTYIIFSVVVME